MVNCNTGKFRKSGDKSVNHIGSGKEEEGEGGDGVLLNEVHLLA